MNIKVLGKSELSPDTLVSKIRERKAEIERLITDKEKAIMGAPEGKLRFVGKGKAIQYYHKKDNYVADGVYLKRSQNSFAAALAQKDYDLKLISELKVEKRALDRILNGYRPERIDEIYVSLHVNNRLLIRPVKLLDEDYVKRWMKTEYEKKPFEENAPEFYTAKGERVRSKSEIIIADALSRSKIPYRYEYPISISGLGMVHPDFTCLNVRKRKEYIWEHNGMMSDSEYADYTINRIEKYTMAGFCLGDNLILSFETSLHPLNSRVIENYIQEYLL